MKSLCNAWVIGTRWSWYNFNEIGMLNHPRKETVFGNVSEMSNNLFKPRHGDLVTTYHVWKLGNIGSGNGMLPDGTKPLFEPMLIYHQWGSATTIRGQLPKRYFGHQYLELSSKLFYKISFKSPRGLRVNQFQTKYRAGRCTPQCQMLWSQWTNGK